MFSLNGKRGHSMIAINEKKAPSPAELAEIIRQLRERNKWSQAALAATAGLSERTIQRVENAQGSNHQTRRSLAGAFGFQDRDIFERPIKPLQVADDALRQFETKLNQFEAEVKDTTAQFAAQFAAQVKDTTAQLEAQVKDTTAQLEAQVSTAMDAFTGELEKFTELVQTVKILNGRTLREFVDHTPKADLFPLQFGDHTPAARQPFADLVDYLHDYHTLIGARHFKKEVLRGLLEEKKGQCTMDQLHYYHHLAKDSLSEELERTRTSQRTMKFGDRPAAREAFAELDASATEQIGVDAYLDTLLTSISEQHCAVGVCLQDGKTFQTICIVLAQQGAFPANIRVPKNPDLDHKPIIPTIRAALK
jgi:transcriptional regulator with XRE-family HTH domain